MCPKSSKCNLARLLRDAIPSLLVIWLLPSSRPAHSAELTLFTNAPPQSPLVITPQDTTGQLLVSVVNSVAADPPTEYLTGWQFRLVIQPDAGALGNLEFGSGATPPNYVMDSVVHLGPQSATVNGVFSALDTQFSFPLSGVPVPTAPGANLMSISWAPAAGSLGRFGVYAKDGQDSFWLDAANDPNNHPHPFVNTPVGGGLVRIADVLVTSVADYNRNGEVDAADYIVWRHTLNQTGAGLPADGNNDGVVNPDDYDVWRAHFGQSAGVGAASRAAQSSPRLGGPTAAVPEPSNARLLYLAAATAAIQFALTFRKPR
jgi:hypothetical protein